jgi:hypothetical protein
MLCDLTICRFLAHLDVPVTAAPSVFTRYSDAPRPLNSVRVADDPLEMAGHFTGSGAFVELARNRATLGGRRGAVCSTEFGSSSIAAICLNLEC